MLQVVGGLLLLMGASMVAGYFAMSRRQHYVLMVGLSLLALGMAFMVALTLVKWALVGLAVAALLVGLVMAVLEIRQKWADIERERQGRQAELEAYLEQLKRKYMEPEQAEEDQERTAEQ